MAKWRALHASITTDGKVNRMSEFAQLLYDRMMVKADDWGVVTGDSFELKGETVPLSSRTFQELDDAIQEMVERDLAWQYEPEGFGPLVQIRKFDEHQPKGTISKRTAPQLPLHPDWEPLPDDNRSVQLLESLETSWKWVPRVDKSRVDKNRVEVVEPPPFSSIFTETTGLLVATGTQAQEIDAWMEDVPEEWFRDACKAAVDNNARKWAYVRAVLKRCKSEGKAPGEAKRAKSKGEPELTPEQLAEYFPES